MKTPPAPPKFDDLLASISTNKQFAKIITSQVEGFVGQKYIHWDKLKYYDPPNDLDHNEWWLAIKIKRKSLFNRLPLIDAHQSPFQYLLAGPILEILHRIDLGGGGSIQMPEQITNADTKDQYYVSSLIEEAITSSQLEGAATTRTVADDMLRSARKPRDKSERMILNNFLTMKRIVDLKDKPLTKELIFEIFNLITEGTLEDPSAANRFRRDDENIIVGNEYGDVFHRPPPADELEERLNAMCNFANGKTPKAYTHPVIRAIILHFWLSYIHPFVDGNGRTARALFYWSMLRNNYWLCEYISISSIIHKAPSKYGMAFLHSETDDNDLTYFIYYHLKVLLRAIHELHDYINRKTQEIQNIERDLRGLAYFNYRQQALISHALRHPQHKYTIESHRMSHNVVPQTARTDLNELVRHGILSARKNGKRWYFTPTADIPKILSKSKFK